MPEYTKEWKMVLELAEIITSLATDEQEEFVTNLYHHLDPFAPFLEQCSLKQLEFLKVLHEVFVDGNEEAYRDL